TLLFTRQLLETTRSFLDLVGKRTLLRAAAATASHLTFERTTALTLGFLLLPACELLQLLEQFVDLTIALLFGRLVRGLVAARHLVELLLEDVGELLLHLSATTTAATALLLLDADLRLILLFGLLQDLQRLVLGRQRRIRSRCTQLAFRLLH